MRVAGRFGRVALLLSAFTARAGNSTGNPIGANPAPPSAPLCPMSPPISEAATGPGSVDPFRPPAPEATALNAAAKILYRQGRWDEARAKYHAAEVADPEFLAPVLNIACSFVRQERFAEATTQVVRLLERAFVPWSREILTAADLGALKVQPQMAQIRQALADEARRWGADLETELLFVARMREPLKLPPIEGATTPVVLVLGLHQEIFAWSPVTDRYRQITAEDGHVLAMARSTDRRSVLYVTGEKLLRAPHAPPVLRGLTLHTLALPTMTSGATVPLDGDVARLGIAPQAGRFALTIEGDTLHGSFALVGEREGLDPTRPLDERAQKDRLVVLTGAGVTSSAQRPPPVVVAGSAAGACPLMARQFRGTDGIARIEISSATGKAGGHATARVLRPRFGAGLAGLPFP